MKIAIGRRCLGPAHPDAGHGRHDDGGGAFQ